jgi:PKHD-type hydroxylase
MFQAWQAWYGQAGVTDLYIDEIEKAAATMEFVDGQLGHHETGRKDESYRRSQIKWLQRDHFPFLVDVAFQFAVAANKNAFGVNITDLPQLQYTVYDGKNQGYYDWHADTFWTMQEPFDRKLSIIIQLTDGKDYEGGDLELEGGIPPFDKDEIRKKGSVIVFPSVLHHRVTPVTKGIRKSLVGWIEGPASR